MSTPQVHVPYSKIGEYLKFIKEHRLNLEIFFSAQDLDSLESRDLEGVLERLDYNPAFTVHSPFMDLSPAAVDSGVRRATHERFSQVLDASRILKPKAIVFHSGYEKWKYAHKVDVWLKGSLDMWPEFIEMAKDLGSVIAIENIFEDKPDNLSILMNELSSDSLGICFDTGHMNIFSEVPLSEWMDQLGEHIVELHLHDNAGDRDSHIPVGEGTFDFGALFEALKGRDLIRTVEATKPEDVLTSLARLEKY